MDRLPYRDYEHFQKLLRTRKLVRAIELIEIKHFVYYRDKPLELMQAGAQHLARLWENAATYELIYLEDVLAVLAMYSFNVPISDSVRKRSINLRLQKRLST